MTGLAFEIGLTAAFLCTEGRGGGVTGQLESMYTIKF